MSYWLYVIATNGDYDKDGMYDGETYEALSDARKALRKAEVKNPECDIVIESDYNYD